MHEDDFRYPTRRTVAASNATTRRSHAAIPVAVAVGLIGLYFGTFSILVPAVLGFVLLVTGGSFLSSRINPLSTAFYQGTKPSWAAVGVVFLMGLLLIAIAYTYFVTRFGPLFP